MFQLGHCWFFYWLLQGCAENRVKSAFPKQSHSVIRHNFDPVSRISSKWPMFLFIGSNIVIIIIIIIATNTTIIIIIIIITFIIIIIIIMVMVTTTTTTTTIITIIIITTNTIITITIILLFISLCIYSFHVCTGICYRTYTVMLNGSATFSNPTSQKIRSPELPISARLVK